LRTWIIALLLISATLYLWPILVSVDYKVGQRLDENIGSKIQNGTAPKQIYTKIRSTGTNLILIIGPLAVVVYLIWAFLSMQRKERITGYYQEGD